ncbi:hypothetical protein WJU23_23235 [Prosthecobacter sp. SYSU 5D2]|uniref:hypothetical protein n=1 Tax=Prosthecobacter sp. SYSU 5D2 TaxID=3134134 RepID=UPI0031FE7B20
MASRSINKLLRISPRFLRSAQLERDFRDPEALGGYVLTQDTRAHLSRLLKGTRSVSGQRSWRVTGDFGSGKSSFALLLANLLSPSSSDLPKHLRGLPVDMGLTRSRRGFLPVLVTGSRQQMSMALLSALSNSLHQNIDGRKKLKVRMAVDETLAAPKSNLDHRVIALLIQASAELRQHDLFDGVLVIIDELGKFLEYSALNPEKQDVYFLQQLGEASSRSGENCLFTVGLLHQGFSTYADKLTEQAQREWEKVAERFEEIVFAQPLSQVASLLSAALNVKEDECPRGWKSEAHTDMRAAVDLGLFGANAGKSALVELAPSLYPLHPTVLPVLAKFFRRFGQNERSLFSFLLSSEPHALQDFAQNEATLRFIYRLPEFYDFIAQNFGGRLSAQSFRSHWSHIDAVIRSFPAERELELRILKTIGVLNTIDSTADLLPRDDLLALALGNSENLKAAVARLKKENLLFFRGARRGYALWSHTSVNLEHEYAKASESIQQISNMGELLRARLDARPVVARAHYIRTGNLRHFTIRFSSTDEISADPTIFQPEYPADGMIVIVLSETEEQRKRAQKQIAEMPASPQVLFGVTEALEVLNGFILSLERWNHVERHTPELKDDRFAAEEVSRQIAHANQALENALHRYVGFRGLSQDVQSRIHWFYNSMSVKGLDRDGSLQCYLSELCDSLFPKAPNVHNELVNRNTLSSAAAAARQRLFELMLNHGDDPHLGLPLDKAPPEKSLYLSVLKESGIHAERAHGWSIEFPEKDPLRLRPALEHVIEMLEARPDARIRVDRIVEKLRRPPYGVRDGLIPVLLVAIYVQHEAELAIYEDGRFVSDVEEFLKMRLAKAPQTFEFQLCRIHGMRRELLSHLAEVVKLERAERTELLSIVRPICLIVAELPDYAKNTENLSPQTITVRKHVLAAEEPAHLVFRDIPEALGFKGDVSKSEASKLASKLAQSLSELRRALPECRKRMTQTILEAFSEKVADFSAWRRSVAERAETVIVGVTNPELRAFTLKLIDDATEESVWLEALGSLVTRVPPSRWRDKDETAFREGVLGLVRQFQRVESLHFGEGSRAPENAVRIALTQKTGEERDQVFHLSSSQVKEAIDLRKRLQSQMPEDKKLAVAALSQLLWEMMDSSS